MNTLREDIHTLLITCDKIEKVIFFAYGGSSEEWSAAFDEVFALKQYIDATSLKYDWCDLDSSYEDDVRSFFNAINDMKRRYLPIFATLSNELKSHEVEFLKIATDALRILYNKDTDPCTKIEALEIYYIPETYNTGFSVFDYNGETDEQTVNILITRFEEKLGHIFGSNNDKH